MHVLQLQHAWLPCMHALGVLLRSLPCPGVPVQLIQALLQSINGAAGMANGGGGMPGYSEAEAQDRSRMYQLQTLLAALQVWRTGLSCLHVLTPLSRVQRGVDCLFMRCMQTPDWGIRRILCAQQSTCCPHIVVVDHPHQTGMHPLRDERT